MAGYVEHVIDPAHDPVVAVVVAAGVVAGQVMVRHLAPIDFLVACIIAPDAAEHAGPGVRYHKPTALVRADRVALRVDDSRDDARQRLGATAWLGGDRAGERAHHDTAGLGLPPSIDDRAPLAANHAVVPHP